MIACVNPSSCNVHETINTLRYAEQARNIKIKVQALSTIKKKEGKRRLEDVSANSGAWKKRAMSTEKVDHNCTISTPGHKPPVRKLAPLLNRTVATPSRRLVQSEVLGGGFPESINMNLSYHYTAHMNISS
ncbi:Chromosome-associated kinesin KIF4A [Portunus trituberculatus]|uniref:Chromosome-associated kinesin KIF4A n=1 Tax=Portunus trituberculatus TaxID=210409 RepID=A0A5B7JE62_PORTR|nr:Chromosome-associated kinesin KIF4A [Portunus trituberculatus]